MPRRVPDLPRIPSTPRLAVLLSGGGTTMVNLHDRIGDGRLDAEISCVIASRADAGGLARATARGLPTRVIGRAQHPDAGARSAAIFEVVRESRCDLVCLCGYLSLLTIPDDFSGRVLNIHPSLLPSFGGRGMFGRHVHQAVLGHGCAVSGCTVHLCDNTYDTGPILVQRACAVEDGDDAEALAARVFVEECEAYPAAIRMFPRGG